MTNPAIAIAYQTSTLSSSSQPSADWSEELAANGDQSLDNSSIHSESPSSAASSRKAARRTARRAAKIRQGHRQHQRLIRRNSSRKTLTEVAKEARRLDRIEDLPGSKFTSLTPRAR